MRHPDNHGSSFPGRLASAVFAGWWLLLLAGAAPLPAASLPDLEAMGRSVKFRIVVDKVMQPVEEWTTKEWMVREAAEAGFNVFCPRAGFDRLDEVRQAADWCAKYGILYMPWMRGTLKASMDDASAAGRRLVWENGVEQPLWSPNADELWQWMTRYIVEYAKLSRSRPALIGVFLDYENYAPGRVRNAYSLSYDDAILAKFAKLRGIDLPDLPLDQRRKWLEEQGLFEAFRAFQIGEWRRRCRELRKAVDAYNPKFRFCVYPAPGTPFIREAIYPEWATKDAPLILADACTYGRPSRFIPQERALEMNREKLLQNVQIPQAAGIPFIYLGGIDPVVAGADPEFCGKNAVMISQATDGYWIFYEGPKYDKDHPHYWKWFTWANRAIAAGRLDAWREPRKEPEDWFAGIFASGGGLEKIALPSFPPGMVTYKPVHFRGEHLLILPARKGRPVHVRLRHRPVGKYVSPLAWEVRDNEMHVLKKGKIPDKSAETVTFEPTADGVYLMAVSAGSCAWSVEAADVPVGVLAAPKVHLIGGPYRLWFTVPPGVKQFRIRFKGEGLETIRVSVLDPRGRKVAEGQTSLKANRRELTVKPEPDSAGVWSILTDRADEGVIEDNTIVFDRALPPVMVLDPSQAYGVTR